MGYTPLLAQKGAPFLKARCGGKKLGGRNFPLGGEFIAWAPRTLFKTFPP